MIQADQFDNLSDEAFIRVQSLPSLVGFSVPTIWRKTKDGKFPTPVKVSEGITAWRVGEIRKWLKDPQGFKASTEVKGVSHEK